MNLNRYISSKYVEEVNKNRFRILISIPYTHTHTHTDVDRTHTEHADIFEKSSVPFNDRSIKVEHNWVD